MALEINKTQSAITITAITVASAYALHKWKHNWAITIFGGLVAVGVGFFIDTAIQSKMQG